ncbi:NAD(P)/FAD-dependent oxidoreductase [Thalassococcus sp. CAU 1522]|uniref:NAD(P)/FAD-dependent oxidoreductase n=1 Tax=Thalassococcus arenae TaxID=2851652 RepID=A0ABS6N925_9RHOB|nr:NAD(P)/FAD-dependent oxidoreductase [Thalassococcus arenae]MBV2360518.1 NAD(P)/FAD-dependent oxidoreductase [Thalassococcus arenae]
MKVQTLILGAGAAGLMAAAHAGPDTLVIDHARAPGEKIRISGGGRCNFTNLNCAPVNFLGQNPHFHKSALSRYTPWDFLDLVNAHGIAWHEKTLGQLFCDGKATQIVAMLLKEMEKASATLWLQTAVREVAHDGGAFRVTLEKDGATRVVTCANLVLATGGKSIPKMGATGLAYDVAAQFGHAITETRPALVPFTFDKDRFAPLAGISCPSRIRCNGVSFDEALLFTHRGLSGPAVLQVSSYWREGQAIEIDLLPETDLGAELRARRVTEGRKAVATAIGQQLPARLADSVTTELALTGNLADLSDKRLQTLDDRLHRWSLRPTGTEGYRTAEVTLGGIATDAVDSKTMMSKHRPGLYIIGEALDVTGWLGGYNFQWAWASAVAAGAAIRGG